MPFLHLPADLTIDDLTLPFFFRTQHRAAFGVPQMETFSHFLINLRHDFWGMRAVTLASLRELCTHFW